MNRIGTEGAHRAPAGESVQDVHSDLTDATRDASSGLHDTAGAAAEQASRQAGLGVSAMLVVLALALIAATAGCLAVVGLGLALWPPALLSALAEDALAARAPMLVGLPAAALAVFWFAQASWRAFARAKAGRCAELMLAALIGALGLHAYLLGF